MCTSAAYPLVVMSLDALSLAAATVDVSLLPTHYL
jgi:hypothetical protein